MSDLIGDPRKTAEAAVKPELARSEKVLGEARERAAKLVEEAFEKSLRESEKRLEEAFASAEEQLKSTISGLELEVKSEVSRVKSEYINAVIDEALKLVAASKGEPWYEAYLEKILLRLRDEGYEELVLRVARDDMDRVQALVAKLGLANMRVSREPADIIGGVIAETPDGSVRLDYSIDLIVKMNIHKLMSTASRNLFLEA